MNEQYFKFREKPFSPLPDLDFLYLGEQHKMALHMLRYGVTSQAGFIVVTGEVGCGKTILVRQLLNELEADSSIGLISDTYGGQGEVLPRVLMAFNLDYADANRTTLYSRLVDFLIAEYAKQRRVVLIVDEAQNMSARNLEELRTLSNVNADKDQLVQLLLLGQPELRETLRQRDMRQFAQQISVDYHLEPLDEQQTGDYIRHRLEVAGGDTALFTEEACAIIHRNTGGVPRLINRLCDTALLYAYGAYKPSVDRKLVLEVARDMGKEGLSGLHEFPSNITDYSLTASPDTLDATVAEDSEYRPETVNYPGVAEDLKTVAILPTLLSYDFSLKATPYFKRRCSELAKVGKIGALLVGFGS